MNTTKDELRALSPAADHVYAPLTVSPLYCPVQTSIVQNADGSDNAAADDKPNTLLFATTAGSSARETVTPSFSVSARPLLRLIARHATTPRGSTRLDVDQPTWEHAEAR